MPNHPCFSRTLTNSFHEYNFEKFEIYVLRDFNINPFKIKSKNRIKTYADDLMGSAIKCLINQPTKVCKNSKSLLDDICSNNLNNQLMPGMAISDISDHYPVFALIPTANCIVLSIFILHSRESELYRCILDGTLALIWELPFPRRLGHLSFT